MPAASAFAGRRDGTVVPNTMICRAKRDHRYTVARDEVPHLGLGQTVHASTRRDTARLNTPGPPPPSANTSPVAAVA